MATLAAWLRSIGDHASKLIKEVMLFCARLPKSQLRSTFANISLRRLEKRFRRLPRSNQQSATADTVRQPLCNMGCLAWCVTRTFKSILRQGLPHPSSACRPASVTRTTQLYDRRRDEVSLDEVERISI